MSESLLLIGTGLIGGSFALAAKRAGIFDRVVGVDRNERSLVRALELGVVDARWQAADDCAAACVAVPAGSIAEQVRDVAERVPLVFDVGSVKQPIVDALQPVPANFVPCHPVAGSERAGPEAADAGLFRGHAVVLTPVAATDASAVAAVRGYWQAVGGSVVVESPADHDDRLALLSHLPHLVAFAFMEVAGDDPSLCVAPAAGSATLRASPQRTPMSGPTSCTATRHSCSATWVGSSTCCRALRRNATGRACVGG